MTTFTVADTNALLIVVLQDGSRITHEIKNTRERGWLTKGLKSAGRDLHIYRAHVKDAVLIDGTDVHHYTGTEPAEILGLDA